MGKRSSRKKEPWRMIVGMISVALIVYMWVKKDIVTIYATMPKEQVAELLVTTIAVSLAKVAAIAGAILLLKWIAGKLAKSLHLKR